MMLDWNDYQKQLLAAIGRISPGTVRGYRELGEAWAATGRLEAGTRELIALAVAVTRQCDGGITVHTDAAVKRGATREEIAGALGVAVAVNAGASLAYSARVMDAFAAKSPAWKCAPPPDFSAQKKPRREARPAARKKSGEFGARSRWLSSVRFSFNLLRMRRRPVASHG